MSNIRQTALCAAFALSLGGTAVAADLDKID
jgi:hypothetical protein